MIALPLRLLVLALATLQIFAGRLLGHAAQQGAFDAARTEPLAQPADWAFGIWGLIFLGQLIYAVLQALPAYAAHPVIARTRLPAALLFLGTAAWLVFATGGPVAWTTPTIIVMLALAAIAVRQAALADGGAAPDWMRTFVVSVFGLTAGWLAIAAPLNLVSLSPDLLPPVPLSAALLAVALVTAGQIAWSARIGAIAVCAALVWGLAGVLLKDTPVPDGLRTLLWVGIAVAIAVGFFATPTPRAARA